MKLKNIRTVLTVLLALVFLVSVGMMIRQMLLYRKVASDSVEAAQIAFSPKRSPAVSPKPDVSEAEPEPEEVPEETPKPLPEDAAALAGLDLEALRAVNPDVAGWIEIPGIDLSNPLMQSRDNWFYLSRNWKRQSSAAGSIFFDAKANTDLSGFNTIIYGHRMRNDSMFGILRRYKEDNFWQEHPYVYVVTEDGVHQYEVFAALEAGVNGIVYRLDIEENGTQDEFIKYCLDYSAFDAGIIPRETDHILTLSTCTGNGYSKRWVVLSVLRDVWPLE